MASTRNRSISSPPFFISGKNYDSWWHKGKDGEYRTNRYEITRLFFSETQIYISVIKFKLTELNNVSEDTKEFFYSDIVSVSTGTQATVLSKANSSNKDASDETISAESFRVVVPGDKLQYAFTSNESINQSVNGMKNLIRQRKIEK